MTQGNPSFCIHHTVKSLHKLVSFEMNLILTPVSLFFPFLPLILLDAQMLAWGKHFLFESHKINISNCSNILFINIQTKVVKLF